MYGFFLNIIDIHIYFYLSTLKFSEIFCLPPQVIWAFAAEPFDPQVIWARKFFGLAS